MKKVDYLLDGMLSGTGVRDAVNGGYVSPGELGLSESLQASIAEWQQAYRDAHFTGYNSDDVTALDHRGRQLLALIRAENTDLQIGYFSDGFMRRQDC